MAGSASHATLTRRAVLGGGLAVASAAVVLAALRTRDDTGESSSELSAEAEILDNEPARISHLLRRAGFGATREEYDAFVAMGLDATIDHLVNYESIDDDEAVAIAGQFAVEPGTFATLPAWWLARMANTRRPLQEKLTLFWHGLLTSQTSEVRDPTAMQRQNEFLRSHAKAAFPEILRGISNDPAMMVYLDVAGSTRRAPNENYARELMELFSLGEGNYTEEDVREASRAFTGWVVPRNRIDQNTFTLQEPIFRPQLFDDGEKTVLGHTGNLGVDDIIDILVDQPASATYIVRRLFTFFVFPDPSDEDLAPFVASYLESGKQIGPVVEAMFRSDLFYSARAYRALVKSPVEYSVGAVRALGQQETFARTLQTALTPRGGAASSFAGMGQIPFEPPNVAGWPGGASWLNSATMFARLNFINELTGGVVPARGAARQAASAARLNLPATAEALLGHLLPITVDDNLPDEAVEALLAFAGGPDQALTEDAQRDLAYLVLSAPQFHLA